MRRHRWRRVLPGLRRCEVCELEEVRRWRLRPPLYRRTRGGTGLPPPPNEGPGPCPGPVRTSAILVPYRLAAALVSGAARVARMPCRMDPPRSAAVAEVAATEGGQAMGAVRVGEVRHELLGWILWPTYEHRDDPQLAGYEDPVSYIAELAQAWGVSPDDAATTWVWRITTTPYREEDEASCSAS